MTTLKIKHGKTSGLFSNFSVRLVKIMKFIAQNKELPACVDSSLQFRNYKKNQNDVQEDLAEYFFDKKLINVDVKKINFSSFGQYDLYKKIDFKKIAPLIETFFSPSLVITNIVESFKKKYSIQYENMCAVYYRGNDKVIETGLAEYEEFFNKAEQVLQKNSQVKFLIQTDEIEFAEAFKQKYPNSFWFDELSMINRNRNSSVHHSLPRNKRIEHASYFFAAVLSMSKMKHLITYSGNCGFWTVLYRGNAENVYQYLKTKNLRTGEIKKDFGWIL